MLGFSTLVIYQWLNHELLPCSVVSIENVSLIEKQSNMNALELIEYNLGSLKGLSNAQYKMEWVNLSTTIGCELFK